MAFYPSSNYPGGFRNGIAISNVPVEIVPEGKVWWVDGNASNNSNGSRAKPWATIATAISKATAGDTIYINAGHTEALTATSFVVNKALTIIGLGKGSRKPTFTTAIEGGLVSITASDVTISNIKLVCNYAGGSTSAISIAADGDYCTLDRIECRDTANTKEWLVHVAVATTVTDLVIQNCSFIGLAGGSMTNSILFAGTTSNIVLAYNHIDVDSSDSTIDHDAGKATNALIVGNIVLNQDGGAAGYCLEMEATSTGHAVGNMCSYNKNDAPVYLGEALFWLENYGGNTAGSSGELDPAAAAIP